MNATKCKVLVISRRIVRSAPEVCQVADLGEGGGGGGGGVAPPLTSSSLTRCRYVATPWPGLLSSQYRALPETERLGNETTI